MASDRKAAHFALCRLDSYSKEEFRDLSSSILRALGKPQLSDGEYDAEWNEFQAYKRRHQAH